MKYYGASLISKLSESRYRKAVFFATFLTGLSSLSAQVVWQKYLAILVGSEARSMSLVVAVFLFGLASGYYYFGRLSEKKWTRFFLMKIYGYIELLTALYFVVFYLYFNLLEALSFNSPAYLIVDIFISLLALFLPTFLMGASIPLLTSTLPEDETEVSSIHARIYGWNTMGAFAGTLLSAFLLVPVFGFALTLSVVGLLNFISAVIFILNPLQGDVQKKQDIQSAPSMIPNSFFMVFIFITGAVVISFEILFVRLLNLSIGAGVYNFPLVLSLFVGGLGLGSLLLPKKTDVSFFIRQVLLSSVFLLISFLTIPYWGVWLSTLRVALNNVSFNYWFYKAEVYLFLLLFILPISFFMGRLLPLAYFFLKKTKDDYGRVCGKLYFFNTLGTVFGAIMIGYTAFYFLNLDILFQINLMALIILGIIMAGFERAKLALFAFLLLTITLFMAPEWDRSGHILGFFRQRAPQNYHFKKLFHIPKTYPGELIYFKDGPNSAAAVTETKDSPYIKTVQSIWPEATGDYMVSVNAKAIGTLMGSDFSTITLLSSFGYLFAPERENLKTAVIGFGTGFTAGLLGKIPEVGEVSVLEIAPSVVEGVGAASSYNLDVMSNPKIKITARDAFRYFTKTKKEFDVIVSEPSNPWVIGVENLFTLEFYELIKKKLSPEGILVQWFHTYSINKEALELVFHTLKQAFPFAELYLINGADVLILSSLSPLNDSWKERFYHPVLMPFHEAMGLKEPEDLNLIKLFSNKRFFEISKNHPAVHSLTRPKLAYKADHAFFMGRSFNIYGTAPEHLFESLREEELRSGQFKKYISKNEKQLADRCLNAAGFRFFCNFLIQNQRLHKQYKNSKLNLQQRFNAYSNLRKRGLVLYDRDFLNKVKKDIIKNKNERPDVLFRYINQVFSGRYENFVKEDILDFKKAGLIKEGRGEELLLNYLSKIKGRSAPAAAPRTFDVQDSP